MWAWHFWLIYFTSKLIWLSKLQQLKIISMPGAALHRLRHGFADRAFPWLLSTHLPLNAGWPPTNTHTLTHTPAVIRTLCKIKSDHSQIESEINCRLCGCPTMYWVKCWLLLLPRLLLLLLLLLPHLLWLSQSQTTIEVKHTEGLGLSNGLKVL